MNTWANQIADCIESENKRCYLKTIPLVLLSAAEYELPWWYCIDYQKANRN